MKIRKRVVGDMYLAASFIFIFLAFLYFTVLQKDDSYTYGVSFLVLGLIIAFVGIVVKNLFVKNETAKVEKKPTKKSKKRK